MTGPGYISGMDKPSGRRESDSQLGVKILLILTAALAVIMIFSIGVVIVGPVAGPLARVLLPIVLGGVMSMIPAVINFALHGRERPLLDYWKKVFIIFSISAGLAVAVAAALVGYAA